MRAIVYVDGLNLFHRCLKLSPYYWVNINLLCNKVLPAEYNIIKIKYFVTRLNLNQGNKEVAEAQHLHLKALKKFIKNLEIHSGYFKTNIVEMFLDKDFKAENGIKPVMAKVVRNEEKGTDVNIATHILNDAWLDSKDCKYDCVVLISNDADLSTPLMFIKKYHKQKKVTLITPIDFSRIDPDKNIDAAIRKQVVKNLSRFADYKYIIMRDDENIKLSQLPKNIPNSKIVKPNLWKAKKKIL